LDSSQRGWRETQEDGRSVKYHQFLHPWDFFGLVMPYSRYMELQTAATVTVTHYQFLKNL
jgi:hypothetical protein